MRTVIVGLGLLLTASAAQAQVIWDAGPQRPVGFDAAGGTAWVASNLGFSSGNISATAPQRWAAMPFTIGAGGATINNVDVDYFAPAGFEPLTINYNIFSRIGLTAPNATEEDPDGPIVSSGVLGLHGPGMDEPRNDDIVGLEEDTYLHRFTGLSIFLPAGDYYFSIYGAGLGEGNTTGFSNAAWFTGANMVPESLERDGMWRSVSYPVPGFLDYNPINVEALAGQDPEDVWNCSYVLYGPEIPAPGAATLLGLGLVVGLRRRR